MYKNLLMIGAVLCGCMCSSAMAENGIIPHSVQIAPTMQGVQDVNQFDINPEINALKAAKAKRDDAIKNSNGDEKKISEAMQKYENIKKQQLENLKNRRRKIYLQGFEVSRFAHAWDYSGDFRIDCPNPAEWVLIPGSGHWVDQTMGMPTEFIVNPREENNGYTVYISEDNRIAVAGHQDIAFTLIARYRYNDAMIARFLEADMARFRERIDAALN